MLMGNKVVKQKPIADARTFAKLKAHYAYIVAGQKIKLRRIYSTNLQTEANVPGFYPL